MSLSPICLHQNFCRVGTCKFKGRLQKYEQLTYVKEYPHTVCITAPQTVSTLTRCNFFPFTNTKNMIRTFLIKNSILNRFWSKLFSPMCIVFDKIKKIRFLCPPRTPREILQKLTRCKLINTLIRCHFEHIKGCDHSHVQQGLFLDLIFLDKYESPWKCYDRMRKLSALGKQKFYWIY